MTSVETFFALVGAFTVAAIIVVAFVGAVGYGAYTIGNWMERDK